MCVFFTGSMGECPRAIPDVGDALLKAFSRGPSAVGPLLQPAASHCLDSLLRHSLPLEASILKSLPLQTVGVQASPPTPLPHLTLFPSNSFALINLGRGAEHLMCYIGRYPVGSCDASLSSSQAFSCLYKWLLPLSYSKIPFHNK